MAGWLTEAPGEWAAVVGPSSRRMIENLARIVSPPRTRSEAGFEPTYEPTYESTYESTYEYIGCL